MADPDYIEQLDRIAAAIEGLTQVLKLVVPEPPAACRHQWQFATREMMERNGGKMECCATCGECLMIDVVDHYAGRILAVVGQTNVKREDMRTQLCDIIREIQAMGPLSVPVVGRPEGASSVDTDEISRGRAAP